MWVAISDSDLMVALLIDASHRISTALTLWKFIRTNFGLKSTVLVLNVLCTCFAHLFDKLGNASNNCSESSSELV